MKKIKSPWYAAFWVVLWTAALIWFLLSGMFNPRECVGLTVVWAVMVGVTVYLVVKQQMRAAEQERRKASLPSQAGPTLNGPCPCGSGKKYKRCCGVPAQ
jgi:TRAP-type C4-dicarboxylate transport system permease large subunit